MAAVIAIDTIRHYAYTEKVEKVVQFLLDQN